MAKYSYIHLIQNKISHSQYYGQFVSRDIKNLVAKHIGLDRILSSKDQDFNDIPLEEWESLNLLFPSNASEVMMRETMHVYQPSFFIRVSKEAARQMLKKELTKKINLLQYICKWLRLCLKINLRGGR